MEELRQFQKDAVFSMLERRDVFVCQPTGSGKSLVYLSLPFFFVQTIDISVRI